MSENDTNTNSTTDEPSKGAKIAGGIVAALVFIGIVGAVFGDDETSASSSKDSSTKSTETTKVTNASKKDEKKSTPREDMIESIENIDDDANVKFAGGDLTVTFPLDTNISTGMMADVARKTTLDVIDAVQESDVRVPILRINGEAEMVDQYGAESTDVVVSATYSARVVHKIETDAVDIDSIWDLADVESYVHSEFQ